MNKKIADIYFLLAILAAGCGKSEAQEAKVPYPLLTGSIVFESNREALSDQMEINGKKYGRPAVYSWQNGQLKKIYKGCGNPRWSEDGGQIVCVMEFIGQIEVVDKTGNPMQRIEPKYYPNIVEWQGNKIIYAGWDRVEGLRGHRFLSVYDLNNGKEELLYETQRLGSVSNITWNQTKGAFIFDLFDKLKGDSENQSYIATFDINRKELTVFLTKASAPVLLNDGVTLLIATNRYPRGEKIFDYKWGALAEYNIQTKEFQVIRPSGWIRNMRLSRDGKYLLVSEDTEKEGVAISIYSVDDLVNPIYQIPTTEIRPGERSQDINADMI